jgi:hypothetical protein
MLMRENKNVRGLCLPSQQEFFRKISKTKCHQNLDFFEVDFHVEVPVCVGKFYAKGYLGRRSYWLNFHETGVTFSNLWLLLQDCAVERRQSQPCGGVSV